jgi:hypothetical protein
MDGKNKKFKSFLLSFTLIASLLVFGLYSVPTAQAHIVIIGSPYSSDSPLPADYLSDAKEIAAALKAKGYTGNKLVELYGKDATSTNILKAMYNADAVIYIGHGGFQSGHYNGNGGTATPPFSLVGSEASDGSDFIWGIGEKMRQGWSETLFTTPMKSNGIAMLFHACFSTGWVGKYRVANPIPTIYNFARMFTGVGINYYASANYAAFYNGDTIDAFLNSTNFSDFNNKVSSDEKLTKSTYYGGKTIWESSDTYVSFIGNWAYKFPSVSQLTDYDHIAAERWYNDKAPVTEFTVSSTNPKVWEYVTFTSTSYDSDVNDTITSLYWKFGDGVAASGNSTRHAYSKEGYYTVSLMSTDTYKKSIIRYKTIKVGNPKPDLYIVSIKKSGSKRYIKIKNKGTATSKGVYLRIWPGKSSKKHYRQVYVKSLKPGYSTTVKITKYYYKHGKAKVDYTNRVSEKSETNNIKSF